MSWTLDYALTSVGELGTEQRLSLGYRWSVKSPAPTSDPGMVPPPAAFAVPPILISPIPAQAPSPLPSVVPGQIDGPNAAVTLKFKQVVEETADWTADQYYQKAEVALAASNQDEALRLLLKCVEKDPNHERAWVRLGQVQYRKSIEAVQKALQANPQNVRLRQWLDRQLGK